MARRTSFVRESGKGYQCVASRRDAQRRPASRRPKTISSSIPVSPVSTGTPPAWTAVAGRLHTTAITLAEVEYCLARLHGCTAARLHGAADGDSGQRVRRLRRGHRLEGRGWPPATRPTSTPPAFASPILGRASSSVVHGHRPQSNGPGAPIARDAPCRRRNDLGQPLAPQRPRPSFDAVVTRRSCNLCSCGPASSAATAAPTSSTPFRRKTDRRWRTSFGKAHEPGSG